MTWTLLALGTALAVPPVAPRAGRGRRGGVAQRAPHANRSSWRAPCRDGSRFARPRRARGAGARGGASRCSSGRSRAPIPTTTPTTTWCGAGELLDGIAPSFEAYAAPTQHPLYVALGARARAGVRRGRGPRARARLPALARGAGVRRPTGSARRSSGAGAARWRALFVAASASFLLYAARGYVDAPFLALVVWAGVLEAERRGPRSPARRCSSLAGPAAPRGVGARRALRGSGVRRAERRASRDLRGRRRRAAVWALTDLLVTGDPLHSLHATSELADDLGRVRGLAARARARSSRSSARPCARRSRVLAPIGAVLAWRVPRLAARCACRSRCSRRA